MSAHKSVASILDRYRGENILLTGATGFLAKSILEKIIRAIPDVGRVYVLVRQGRFPSARERVDREVVLSPIFDRLRALHNGKFDHLVGSKVCPITGDLTRDRLGMSEPAYTELARSVTSIINCAAVCEFGEQLDRALKVNTLGPQRVLQLAKDAGNVPVLHVSTCYVNGTREGDIAEAVLPVGHTVATLRAGDAASFDLDAEIAAMLSECEHLRASVASGKHDSDVLAGASRSNASADKIAQHRRHFADKAVAELGKRISGRHGWIDPYPFTKSLAEQLLVRDRGDVPLAIVRPAIIESTYTEPFPGWIEGLRMGNPLIVAMGKGNLPEFGGRDDNILDFVPCDMVANAVLVAMPPPDASDHCEVYQIASSSQNPLTHRELNAAVHKALHEHPLYERDGEPILPKPVRIIPIEKFERKLEWKRRALIVLRAVYSLAGLEHRARWVARKIRVIRRLREFFSHYGFYASHSPRFLTDRSRALFESLTDEDKAAFPFDVTRIDWSEYFVNRHVPGLARMMRSASGSRGDDAEAHAGR